MGEHITRDSIIQATVRRGSGAVCWRGFTSPRGDPVGAGSPLHVCTTAKGPPLLARLLITAAWAVDVERVSFVVKSFEPCL
jgi:hypothetical protein